MRRILFGSVLTLALATAWSIAPVAVQTTGALDRTVLPIPGPQLKPITTLDARNAKAPARFEVTAPRGVPLLPRRQSRPPLESGRSLSLLSRCCFSG